MLGSGWTFQQHLDCLREAHENVTRELELLRAERAPQARSDAQTSDAQTPKISVTDSRKRTSDDIKAGDSFRCVKFEQPASSADTLPGQCAEAELSGHGSLGTMCIMTKNGPPSAPASVGIHPALSCGSPASPNKNCRGRPSSLVPASAYDAEQGMTPPSPGIFASTGGWSTQPEGSSAGAHLWPEWVEALDTQLGGSMGTSRRRSSTPASANDNSNGLRSGDTLAGKGIWKYCMVPPSSARKIAWDLMSFIMIGYDVMMIPMTAFDIPEDVFLGSMDLVVTIFWTVDIILTFFIGFYDKGILEMRPMPVAKRYFKSWFCTDILVVSTDWLVVGLEDAASSTEGSVLGIMRIGKSVRILRVLRMFRLLRILKVLSMLEELSDMFHSESIHTCLNVVKLVLAIAVVNHFIACGWYAVGTIDFDQGSWTDALRSTPSLGYQYTTSLHWSLTQFTPASMEVVPRNPFERAYAILIILVALVMFSSFISSITSSMTHLRVLREAQQKQSENVRKYISDNKLSMDLSNRIQAFIRQNTRVGRTRVHEQDIPIFKFLPESVRLQMHCEVFQPTFCKHPLFGAIELNDPVGLTKICHIAAQERCLIPGEELFACGQKASHMYFLVGGVMEYHDSGGECQPQEVEQGSRICEIVLWATWEHQGRLTGKIQAELVAIDSCKFRNIARRRSVTWHQCADYGAEYVRRFSVVCEEEHVLPDIWETGPVQLEEMVHAAFPPVALVDDNLTGVLPRLGQRWGIRAGTIGASSQHRLAARAADDED